MSDIREEILNKEYREWVGKNVMVSIYPALFPGAYMQAAINAMDENGKRMCLELLEYVAKNISRMDRNGDFIGYRGDVFTKEQLFENFL